MQKPKKPLSRKANLIKRLRLNSETIFYKLCMKIKDKDGQLVPLICNRAQIHILNKMNSQLARIGKVRAVLLKGRQQGGSTIVGARYYKKATETKGRTAFVLSHEAKTTGKLMQMVKRYHNNCPRIIRPRLGKDNGSLGIEFIELDSSYELGTAGNGQTGRGHTIFFLHGSEVAFWPNGEEILSGLLQAVPNSDQTEVVLESTANGVGGVFYDYVMDAKKGEGEYELIFVPWYWQDEYKTKALPHGFRRTAEEVKIADTLKQHPDGSEYSFEISDRQLMWRRNKIKELKSLDKFKQEYPFTIKEAFLFSGRPAFDVNYCLLAERRCRMPIAIYEVRVSSGEFELINTDRFEVFSDESGDTQGKGYKFKSIAGYLQVWDEPKEGSKYCMGGDVAEGLEHGDYSSFDVNSESGIQVAHYHGHIDPDLFGDLLYHVGMRYNKAYLGVERNNHGLVTLKRLEFMGYPNLHLEQELTKEGEEEKYKLGWYTSSVTKPLIIDELNGDLREEDSGIQCINTIEQCYTYEIDERGRTNARQGCFDDNVMCYAITREMNRRMPKTIHRQLGGGNKNNLQDWRK